MRKTLAVLFVAAALISCGSSTEAPAATACDTCAVAGDTTQVVAVDSTAAAVDSAVAK